MTIHIVIVHLVKQIKDKSARRKTINPDLHPFAAHVASRGIDEDFPVFPIRPNGKKPLTANGFRDATNDPDTLRKWAETWPDANIGHCPEDSGHFVIDIDGDQGFKSLEQFQASHPGLKETYTVRTPSGGLHLWYHGTGPSTVKPTLAPGIDTRGVGGYVLVYPSQIDGVVYTPLSDDTPAKKLPSWVLKTLGDKTKDHKTSVLEVYDTPLSLRRAREFLDQASPAVEGEGGDNHTYQIICEVRDRGISDIMCSDLMKEKWNKTCQPPWDENELDRKVVNVYRYGQNEPGAKAIIPATETFEGYARSGTGEKSSTPPDRKRFQFRDEAQQDKRKDPEWTVHGWIPENSVVMMYGPPESYKSFLALDMALAVASGKEAWSLPTKHGAVYYLAGEGAIGIERKRRPAWRLARALDSQEKIPFYVSDDMPILRRDAGEVQMLIDTIKEHSRSCGQQPKLIFIDTLARFGAGMDENSAADTGLWLHHLEHIRASFPGCTVITIHHSGKDEGRGARGSSALLAGFDVVLQCRGDKSSLTASILPSKMKDAEPPANLFFKGYKILDSLVFEKITPAVYHELRTLKDTITIEMVISALKRLGDGEVTMAVMATELFRSHDPDSKEYKEGISQLKAKARSEFKELIIKDPLTGLLVWKLPETE